MADETTPMRPPAPTQDDPSRWRFALEGAGLGVWDEDLAAGTCYYSPMWKAMLGYAEDELADDGNFWVDLIHPDDMESAQAAGQAHKAGLVPFAEAEFRLRHKDGHWIWVLDRGRVIEWDAQGRPTRMIGAQTDITVRKTAERDLRIADQRIRLAVEAGGIGLFQWDMRAQILSWDQRMHEIYGTDPKTFRGCPLDWSERLHLDDAATAQQAMNRAMAERSQFDQVFRIVRPDGTLRHIRSLAQVVRQADSEPILIGINWDISAEVESAALLAAEKERLRITLQSIGDAVICVDVPGCITFMNAAAEALTGLRASLDTGRRLGDLVRLHELDGRTLAASGVEAAMARRLTVETPHPMLLTRSDARDRAVRSIASPVIAADGEMLGGVLVLQDVTQAISLQRDLAHAATHDALTGLANRTVLAQAVARAIKDRSEPHALLYIDLDRFKIVNDTAGHSAGDALLRDVAAALASKVRPNDVLARLGGDEFALLLPGCSAETAAARADAIVETVQSIRFAAGGTIHDVGASIGVSLIDGTVQAADVVLARADAACYAAKDAGRNRVSVYHSDAGEARQQLADLEMAADLRATLDEGRFQLVGQQIRDLRHPDRMGSHIEVLLRMVARDGSLRPPGAFIPAAERYDMMGFLDRWVISTVIGQYDTAIMAVPNLGVALNLSANSLSDPSLWAFLKGELEASCLDPSRLTFEITETAVINNFAVAERFVSGARTAGCRISLDDFGSGLSSFSYLKRFQVDAIKIDGTFVRNVTKSRYDRTIVRVINEIASELDIDAIAESVESSDIVLALRQLGVRYGQGFHFHRPTDLQALLADHLTDRRPIGRRANPADTDREAIALGA